MTLTQINKAGLDEIALDHVFTIGASGSSAYTFQGEGLNGTVNNPTLYLTRGKTYRFENGSGGHPIRIQSTSGASGTAYNTGVTNNAGSGTVIVEVQHDAPDVLYYQCTSHAAMNGILYITGALADGGVTTAKIAADAVTGAKIADDAISNEHIADNAVGSEAIANGSVNTLELADDAVTSAKIADGTIVAANIANDTITAVQLANNSANVNVIVDGAVTTAKIADQAVTLAKLPHGTSSNDGKFLRANNGADPTFETVSGTTINSNADNRVITGSGTANTLNAESEVLFDATTSDFSIIGSQPSRVMDLIVQNTHNGGAAAGARLTLESGSNANTGPQLGFRCGTHTWYLQVPKAAGNLEFNNNGTGLNFLMADDGDFHIVDGDLVISTSGHGIDFSATSDASGAANELLDDYEEGTFTLSVTQGGGGINGTGQYTKVGRLVAFTIDASLTGSRNYQDFILDGLPYTCGGQWTSVSGYAQSYTGTQNSKFTPVVRANNTELYIQRFGSNVPGDNLGSGYFNIGGTYLTS